MKTVFILITLALGASAGDVDVCYQVRLMSEYCVSLGDTGVGQIGSIDGFEEMLDAKLKEMEERLRESLQSPPPVNYTYVEQVITQKFEGVEQHVIQQLGEPPKVNYTAIEEMINIRFEHLESLVNGVGEDGTSIVDYTGIYERIDHHFTEIRDYVDSRFDQLVNDTDAYQDAVNSMDRFMNVTDCRDIRQEDAKLCNATGGVFDIYRGLKKYEVFCDSYTDGGGWTVFHRREGNYDFNRTWVEYEKGFGEPNKSFWLGLAPLHELLSDGDHELRIDVMDSDGSVRYMKYGGANASIATSQLVDRVGFPKKTKQYSYGKTVHKLE